MARKMKLIEIINDTPIPVAYKIAFLTNFYREPLLRRMEQEHGIIRPEWTVLICLVHEDGLNPRDICEITEQQRNTVSRAVASLEAKGLIRREDDPDDARRTLLFLRPAGRRIYEAIMPPFVEGEQRLIDCLDAGERKTLEALLEKMCRAVAGWTP
jgi:DNA-binding MarR family transcriptional regulator